MLNFMIIAGLVPVLLTGASPSSAAEGARFDPKGRDIDSLAWADSLARQRAADRESARIEGRRAFIEALRLNAPDAECIAQHLPSGKCLLDVRTFNRFADASVPPPDSAGQYKPSGAGLRMDVDSARSRLAAMLLRDAYPEYRMEGEARKDSLKAEVGKARARKADGLRKASGDAGLRRLYRQYQGERFDAREVREYRVVGSSDSAYADSLARACPAIPQGPASPGCESLPWSRIREEDIPASAAAALQPSGVGGTSRPIRTRFGFFLFRLDSVRRIPGIPYEEALPVLAALASLPRGTEPRLEDEMAVYYRKNRHSFRAPDTVALLAWIRPSVKRKAGEFATDIKRKIRLGEPVADTLHVAPLRIPMDSLPEEVRKHLAGMPRLQAGRFFGPVNSGWGTWYFRVAENRRGTRPLDFDEARGRIMAILFPGMAADRFAKAQDIATSKLNDIRSSLLDEYHARDGAGKTPGGDWAGWLDREVAVRSGAFNFRLPDSL